MVNKTQLKIADKNDCTDEDPLAELTRIIGFGPRQPVVHQYLGAPTRRDEQAVDYFGIDLEKELLGEFTGDDLATQQSAAYTHPQESAFDESISDDTAADSFGQGLAFENELIVEPEPTRPR